MVLQSAPTCVKWCRLRPSLWHHLNSMTIPVSVQELGAAGLTKRPTSCMLILPLPAKAGLDDEAKQYRETFDDVFKRVKSIQPLY